MRVEDIDRITCLCCDRRKENIQYIKLLAKYFKLDINIFIAGNGKDPELEYNFIDNDCLNKHYNINDAHRVMIREAKQLGCRNILLLEDDITFTRDFLEILDIIKEPDYWDSIALGGYTTDRDLSPTYDNRIICLEKPERIGGFFGIIISENQFNLMESFHLSILADNVMSDLHKEQYFLNRPIIVERPIHSAVTTNTNNSPYYIQALEEGRILSDKELIYQDFCRIK